MKIARGGCVPLSCLGQIFFVVKKYAHGHTCDTTHMNVNHRQTSIKIFLKMSFEYYNNVLFFFISMVYLII